MKGVFRASMQTYKDQIANQPLRPTHWLKRVSLSFSVMLILTGCARIASAQLMSPGYVFVEVSDEAGRPVRGAAVVLYDLEGREVGSNITDQKSLASINKRSYEARGKLIVRATKPGYMTLEVILDTNTPYWQSDDLKIKLISISKPARKNEPAPRKSRPARAKRAPPANGLSPPH